MKLIYTHNEDGENDLPMIARELPHDLWIEIKSLHQQILKYDRKLYQLASQMKAAKRLMTISDVGEVSATAVVANVCY